MGYLIYDLEIVKAIPDRNKPNEPGIEYCAGWDDHANMLSLIHISEPTRPY